MNTIRIESEDCFYNAGIVGLVQILEYNNEKVIVHGNCIEIEESSLDDFEYKYFKFAEHKYKAFTSWNRIVSNESYIQEIKNTKEVKKLLKQLDKINRIIEYTKNKLKSASYKSAYKQIKNMGIDFLEEEKQFKKIVVNKNNTDEYIREIILGQIEKLEYVIECLKKEDIRQNILAKNIAYDIIQNFWNGVGFLDSKKSTLNIFKEYDDYFMNPIKNYLNTDKTNSRYNCSVCNEKIVKLDKPDAFNLTWINGVGIDGEKKSSHFWGMNRNDYICPICNLVYACIPMGFTFLKGIGLFVNNNIDISAMVETNNHILTKTSSIQEIENKSYLNLAKGIKECDEDIGAMYVDNVQVIKMDIENKFKTYSFEILSNQMIEILVKNEKMLKILLSERILWYTDSSEREIYKYLYKEVLDRLYSRRNLFDLIKFCLDKIISDEYSEFDKIEILLRINSQALEDWEIDLCTMDNKKVHGIKCLGSELRKNYEQKKIDDKIKYLSFNLINTIESKNKLRFIEHLIRMYSFARKEVPGDFINCLENDMSFQTVGYSFLLGLLNKNSVITK